MTEAVRALLLKSQKGDKNAFGELVMLYADYVFSVVFRLLNQVHISEDIVQETFIKAWEKISDYQISKGKFTTWLFVIATRLTLDYMRDKKLHFSLDSNFDVGVDPASDLELDELGSYIRHVCDQLSETQKLVFVLRELEELSVSEVVEITGFSEKKIKDNLYVARQKVRVKLSEFLNA